MNTTRRYLVRYHLSGSNVSRGAACTTRVEFTDDDVQCQEQLACRHYGNADKMDKIIIDTIELDKGYRCN